MAHDIDRCGFTHHMWGLMEGFGMWAIVQGDTPVKWLGAYLMAIAFWMVIAAARCTRRLKAAYGENA